MNLTDRELVEQFENCTLPLECFHHEQHVRVAFLYLCQYPVPAALERFSEALRRFAGRHGKAGLYHETITWAYILLIRERMARGGNRQSWDEFKAKNAELFERQPGILKNYYLEETLASELAKGTFVLPDRLLKLEA